MRGQNPDQIPQAEGESREQPQAEAGGELGFYVVGVGASAGGLEALEEFFAAVPPDPHLAFVVIQHLSPDFRSVMDELLARHTEMPIHRVENGMPVEPNRVYLIPPGKEMIISGGRLLLTDKDPKQSLTLPIDLFFRSLAQDVGRRSIAVVLSGTGSDGSRGICHVHEAGGLVFAQSPDSARFDGMPKSALDTGIVDFSLPPREIPDAILKYVRNVEEGRPIERIEDKSATDSGVEAILQLMRETYDIDFAPYKPTTIGRRVERRILLSQATDLDEYVDWLRENPHELHLLYKDLLIGVTKFFRDKEAFERLERSVLPQLARQRDDEDEYRIWVPGCATGEEAYTLAILLHEQLERMGKPLNVKIFATDVHRASLEYASTGCYSEACLSEMERERIDRYFVRRANGYQISQNIRQMVVFASHNVLRDAPFTKLDLISCRNLLIYFQPIAQKKALCLFHFGLKTGGYLLLGPSETPGELVDEFDAIDQRWKVYRKKRDIRLPNDIRLPLDAATMNRRGQVRVSADRALGPGERHVAAAQEMLLEQFAPPSLMVDSQFHLLHSFCGAGRYLVHPDGRPSLHVLDLVDRDLKLALAGALQRVRKEGEAVIYTGIRFERAEEQRQLKVSIRPVTGTAVPETAYLITLEDLGPREVPGDDSRQFDFREMTREQIQALENELQYTKESLQATVEEMETTNEELQAANEELVASNEQLQSTNEELHSVNEELYTVNAEYQRKIAELTELTSDMENLLASTEIATIFLDRNLCIRKFTPPVVQIFHFLPQDVGRSVENFSHTLQCQDLLTRLRQVLMTASLFEAEVQDRAGRWFLMRILPYRAGERVDGVVLSLIGIERLKQTERALRRMSKVFMDAADPILIEDLSGMIIDLNAEAERTYGWPRQELLGQNSLVLVPPHLREKAQELRDRCKQGGPVRNVEMVRCTKSGQEVPVLLTLSLLSDEAGKPSAMATIAKDISLQKQAETEAREAVRRRDQFLAMLSHELRNPLGAILHATHLLPDDSAAEPAAVIRRQAQHMGRLLNDLLDVARVTQGKIHLQREPVDLALLVPTVVEAVRPLLNERFHELVLNVPTEPVIVEGDAARLRQIQENLLTNAAKYTPPHGKVHLLLEKDGSSAIIRVRDTGTGFSREMQQRMFELFMQGDDTLARKQGGMGVGLTLVRSLVELHGGTVEAHSDGPGRGAEFTVRLPLGQQEDVARPAPPLQEPIDGQSLRVLVVEDLQDSREMLRRLLELEHCQVRVAKDGPEGLRLLREFCPDLALVDIGLPGMDGYELARTARREKILDQTYLVALTGYGRHDDRERAFAAGFEAHFVKPVEFSSLRKLLAQLRTLRRAPTPGPGSPESLSAE